MGGSLTYGSIGRLVSVLAIISAFTGSLEASGLLGLLPEKYSKAGLAVTELGLLVAGMSERVQGGASKPEVRAAAESSDRKNAMEDLNKGV
jgi:hypothetical protein